MSDYDQGQGERGVNKTLAIVCDATAIAICAPTTSSELIDDLIACLCSTCARYRWRSCSSIAAAGRRRRELVARHLNPVQLNTLNYGGLGGTATTIAKIKWDIDALVVLAHSIITDGDVSVDPLL